MALWGNKDLVSNTGTIAIDVSTLTVTGTGTTFVTDGVSEGDVITVGAGATYGYAIVESVVSATSLTISDVGSLVSPHNSESGTDVPAGATFEISQEPLYTVKDSTYRAPAAKSTGFSTSPVTTSVYGVDQNEVSVASTTPYAVSHSGWVGITTYTDMHGNLRVKSEVLVAGGILTTTDSVEENLI
jgi:hypothetical protein